MVATTVTTTVATTVTMMVATMVATAELSEQERRAFQLDPCLPAHPDPDRIDGALLRERALHWCLGLHLARLEMRAWLERCQRLVADRFHGFERLTVRLL